VTTVCISANTLAYTTGGGHLWVFLNWALGFRANGCDVLWLEEYDPDLPASVTQNRVDALRAALAPYGLANSIVLAPTEPNRQLSDIAGCIDVETAADHTDLFLNVSYRLPSHVVERFRRTALLDIDPGLLQHWVSRGEISLAHYDSYFTIGETVGQPHARFPDLGLAWQYTPPAVALDCWPVHPPGPGARFTTVAHWYMHEWMVDETGTVYENNKRSGFVPYFDLPRYSPHPLELALSLGPGDESEQAQLEEKGWRIRHAAEVSSTPQAYHRYIQESLGEFSGVKPSCIRFQNAWISDRSICFLASGKPVIVQNTGPSRFLPSDAGLFRFDTFDDAVRCLDQAMARYDHHARLARALAEEYFDAVKATRSVLERALS
jgi:hypothetical protein